MSGYLDEWFNRLPKRGLLGVDMVLNNWVQFC